MTASKRKVAILGAGPIGCATAAHMAAQGREAALWSPTGSRVRIDNGKACFRTKGALDAEVCVDWLDDLGLLTDFDEIIICLPGNLYQNILPDALPHLRSGQTVLVSSALSLVTLWLSDQAQALGKRLRVGGWSTTATTAHFEADGRLHLNELRGAIGLSSARPEDGAALLQTSEHMLGARFVRDASPLASAIANINPIAHAAEVIPNLSRMVRGEDWPLFGCFGIEVGRLAQRLDDERLAIGAHFGFTLRSLAEHYHRSYHVPLGPLHEIAAAIEAAGKGPLGPKRLEHRYVLEDMPFGLAFQERLAQLAGIPCPAHSSALTVLEIVYDRDLRNANFLLDALLPDARALAALAGNAAPRCDSGRDTSREAFPA